MTLARILMTPVIAFLILEKNIMPALGLMFLAGITDMLDGLIARYYNMRTTVGSYLDPLADKLMLITVFVSLFIVDQVPLHLFLAVVFRDAVIVIGAMAYELMTHSLKMEPTYISKATTTAQIIYVLVVLISMVTALDAAWLNAMAWVTFALTCASGIHYLISWTQKAIRNEQKEHD
jgi:cardiolipin synthase